MIQISANPTGGVVVLGDAQIQSTFPGLTTIHQQTDRAVIDWSTFNIASGEHTNFIVPDANSATLNRVLDGGPSLLNGTLTSNGQVFLINASGIIFGQGSMVDVAGLTASTLDLSNRMFMAGGEMVYQGSTTAGVTNAGSIRASSGDVFLIGFQVNNSGAIRAPNGTVGLAAGTDVLIMPAGDERVIVRNAAGPMRGTGVTNSGLIEANVAELNAHGGNVYALAIRNTGRIAATSATRQGGRIILSANGGRIESTGKLVARGPSGNGGQININAGSKGSVALGGRVDANGSTGRGGSIAVTGGEVTVRRAIVVSADGETAGGLIEINARPKDSTDTAAATTVTIIDGTIRADAASGTGGVIRLGGTSLTLGGEALISASGATGGGSIFAGGGAQGLDASIANATQVEIQQGAILAANAITSGSGGTVVAFASDQLTFYGSLQARGGQTIGDGGQAELSGKRALILESLTGSIDLSSPQGNAGTLLLDPNDILITGSVAGNTITNPAQANTLKASDISAWLDTNCGNLIIQTDSNATGGAGNITLAGLIQWSSATTLTINADRDFIMSTQSGVAGVIHAAGSGAVVINAGRSVQILAGSQILTHSGNVTIHGNQGAASIAGDFQAIYIGGQILSESGNITLVGRTGATSSVLTGAILLDNGSAVSAGTFGVVTLQTTGGSVLGHGSVTSWGLKLAGADAFYFTNVGNAVQTLTTIGTIGSIQIVNTLGLTIGTIGADSGLRAFGDISITTTNSDHIRVNNDLSSKGGAIILNAYGIEVNGSHVSNTGTGVIYMTVNREINVNSGATISVVDGRMELNANQYTQATAGSFTGIVLDNATLTTSGMGAIALNGRSGDTGDGNIGILMQHGSTIHSTSTLPTAGGITLLGVAGSLNGSGNRGVSLQDAGTAITSAVAVIDITGSGTPTGVQNTGVDLGANTTITNSSAIIINTDTVSIAGAATIGGTGLLAIRSVSAGTTIGLGDGAAGTLLINAAGIGALSSSLSHITIGAATSGAVEIRASTWRAPLTILTLGEITVSEQIIDLGGAVTLNGSNTLLFAGIATAGGEIFISSPISLSADATLDTTRGGSVPNGASITVSGAISNASSTGRDLTLNAGLAGDVTLQSTVGQTAALHAVNLTGGRLVGAPQISAQGFSASFNGVIDLSHVSAATVSVTGRAGDDTILLSQAPASLTVNGAAGNDTVSFAAATGPVSINAASFTNIENVIGSASHADTLVGAAGGNVFQITANNAGALGTLHFSSIENLTGSSTGANQFSFSNQATIDGMVNGAGNPLAVLIVNDTNLQAGQGYTIGASLISVDTRNYAFTGVNTVGLNLGAGNDNTATSFFTFTQNLSGGGGDNQLFVDGSKVVTTPLTKAGFGSITTIGFSTSTVILPVTNVFLQNFNPGGGSTTSPSSTQTNNFNSTSVSGAAGGIGAQGIAGAMAGGAGIAGSASTSAFLGQAFGTGSGSMGGGGPASLGLQSQMNSSTSATAERELNMSLGGDGTIRLQNGGGLFAIAPDAGAPSVASMAQLNAGMSLLAQSELAIGAIGNGEVPLTVQAGAQSITLGDPLPSLNVQQFLNLGSNPEAFSILIRALGGDGTARLEFGSGSITVEVNGRPVPATIETALLSSISPGAFGELSFALGGRGDYIVTYSNGLAVMDATGTAAPPAVQTHLHSLLASPGAQGLSLALGDDGTALVVPWDGIVNTALNGIPPGTFVIFKLGNATTPQSQEELDHALR
ncbi:MAG: filamentous hemagglutinin N-terminal domain-containing protein [Prosthecobacter sp.]|uniref:beta strand repeat-containing protein n=1 Tax=Prosthecobacter sp. TaxID=1965333 RepID=UPI00261FB227|nr:filamentous hemagglutinin N-terminal domain-containing protein [Prosthecobacter sp.]MCF7789029.1 filamentous hemagglutinin N-terminal domain-containing protein [Prosthecobacter sp.]